MITTPRKEPVSDVIFEGCEEQPDGSDQLLRNRVHLAIAIVVFAVCAAVVLVVRAERHRDDDSSAAAPATAQVRIQTVYLQSGLHIEVDGDRATLLMILRNSGSAAVSVSAPTAGALPPGLTVQTSAASGATMVELPPGASASLALNLRVTDCSAVPLREWPLRLRAHVAGSADDAYVELTPPGLRGRTWQESAIADYCETGG